MRLRHLDIRDFRSFGHAHFDLSRPDGEGTQDVVLLVGPSGSGKTALLDAVAGFFGGLAGPLQPSFVISPNDVDIYQAIDLVVNDVRQGAEQAAIRAGWSDSIRGSGSTATNLLFDCEARLPSPEGRQDANYWRRPEFVGWSEETLFEAKSGSADLKGWRASIYELKQSTGLIVAFNEHRSLPRTHVAGPNSVKIATHRCLGSLAPLDWSLEELDARVVPRAAQCKQWIVNVEHAMFKAGKRQRDFPLWERLIDALNKVLAPCRFVEIDDQNEILFQTATGTLPVESLSAGFKSLFLIVTDLALRLSLAAGSEQDPFAQEAVCLIDEIDAHLDPALQERVLSDLRAIFPGVQFIATTHSPIVAGTVQRDQIFVLGEE